MNSPSSQASRASSCRSAVPASAGTVSLFAPDPARTNALTESFFATSKNEPLGDRPWPSRSVARTAITEWIEGWCNLRRLHSSLGYRGPAEYETALAA
jgi:transposase InsO family protein